MIIIERTDLTWDEKGRVVPKDPTSKPIKFTGHTKWSEIKRSKGAQ